MMQALFPQGDRRRLRTRQISVGIAITIVILLPVGKGLAQEKTVSTPVISRTHSIRRDSC